MHLILDFGNTLFKHFVFNQQAQLADGKAMHTHWQQTVKQILNDYPDINAVIISDVSGITSEQDYSLFKGLQVFVCNSKLRLPFLNHYKTPGLLGADRIALVAAGAVLYPNKDILIIDLGTCITYDFKDKNNNYWGGAISPGFSTRYKSLQQNTGKLPQLEPTNPINPIGDSTENAIHSGIFYGILFEIQGQIAFYQKKTQNLTIIFAGGDAQMLPKSFKNSIFAHSNFLAKGLNYILELNKTEC